MDRRKVKRAIRIATRKTGNVIVVLSIAVGVLWVTFVLYQAYCQLYLADPDFAVFVGQLTLFILAILAAPAFGVFLVAISQEEHRGP